MKLKVEGHAHYTDMPVASVTIVVACFNEALEIEALCERLLPLLRVLESARKVQLLCIDDGSHDDTLAMLRKYFEHAPGIATDIVSHPRHLGAAEVMRTAFSASRGDIVCAIEGNLRHEPEALGGMIDLLEHSNADIVSGTPFHPSGALLDLPGWRLGIARALSALNALLLPGRLSCYSGMIRAYRRQWFSADYLRLSEFRSLEQILVDAVLAGAKVVEYPVSIRKTQRTTPLMERLQRMCGYLLFVTRAWRQRIRGLRRTRPGYAVMGEEEKRRPFI